MGVKLGLLHKLEAFENKVLRLK